MADKELDPKAGTPEVGNTGDDALNDGALAESAESDDRDAGAEKSERNDWKARYLTETKPALEELNRLKAELEAREREKQPPTEPPQSHQQDIAEVRELHELIAQATVQAQNGDATSKLALKLLEDRLRDKQADMDARRQDVLERQNRDYIAEAVVIGDDGEERQLTRAERQELKAFYERNKAHFHSMEAAHDALLGRKFRETRATLIREQKRVAKDAARRDEGVVTTHHRDVGAGEVRARKMTEAAFKSEQERLRQSGDTGAAYAMMKDRIAGRIRVEG